MSLPLVGEQRSVWLVATSNGNLVDGADATALLLAASVNLGNEFAVVALRGRTSVDLLSAPGYATG